MEDESPVHEWLRVQKELLERESAFTDLAVRVARGQATQKQLDEQLPSLLALREHCAALFAKAFPPGGRR